MRTGAIMPGSHTVQKAENIHQIALEHGVSAKRIWEDPANETLVNMREDGCNLAPDDVLTIPDRQLGIEPASTGRKHRFRLSKQLLPFRVQLFDADGCARAHVDYSLEIAGVTHSGQLDKIGYLEVMIPIDARTGVLTLTDRGADEVFDLDIGALLPVDQKEGQDQRLYNLGFADNPTPEDALRDAAINEFVSMVDPKINDLDVFQTKLNALYRVEI
jgi:hypothetical protein